MILLSVTKGTCCGTFGKLIQSINKANTCLGCFSHYPVTLCIVHASSWGNTDSLEKNGGLRCQHV